MIKLFSIRPIKVSLLWIPAFLFLPMLHVSKIMFFIFLILSIHESCHMLVAWIFHYKIELVTIYPFGFSADIPELGYGSIVKEICIIVAGPLSQVFLPMLFYGCMMQGWISNSFYEYINMLNRSILVFNLLPIYPLDGGRLLQSFFHCVLRFKRAQRMTCYVSFVLLLILFCTQLMQGISGRLVQCFLMIQIVICYKQITHMQVKFYHYRYLHPVSYPICMNRKRDLFRGRYNLMKIGNHYVREEAWLHHQFSSDKKDYRKPL